MIITENIEFVEPADAIRMLRRKQTDMKQEAITKTKRASCRPAQPALLLHAAVRKNDCADHGVSADGRIPAHAQSEKISVTAVYVRRYLAAALLSVQSWTEAG